MDIKARKLDLISYLVDIQDEHIFAEIESYILSNMYKKASSKAVPFTEEELQRRIMKSEENIALGQFKTQEELERISEKW